MWGVNKISICVFIFVFYAIFNIFMKKISGDAKKCIDIFLVKPEPCPPPPPTWGEGVGNKLLMGSWGMHFTLVGDLKPGLHCPGCGARWSPMAKSEGFVSTSANSEGTSVNNVTLPGNILRHRQ